MNNSSRQYDYLFQLVIIGNSGVGKSSILLRFADDQFSESYLTTIGVDFRFKTLPIQGKNVKLQIWDTAGQQRFRTITNAYYQGADGIIIVYDTTSQSSFDDIENFWIKEIETYAEKSVDLILLGNQADLDSNQIVDTQRAQEYATSKQMSFYETSAKTSYHIESTFFQISQKLMYKQNEIIMQKQKFRQESRQKNSSSNQSNSSSNNQGTEDKNRNSDTGPSIADSSFSSDTSDVETQVKEQPKIKLNEALSKDQQQQEDQQKAQCLCN